MTGGDPREVDSIAEPPSLPVSRSRLSMGKPMEVDTIAAPATPPGRGALAVVRVSGPGAVGVIRSVAPALRGSKGDFLPEARRVVLTELADPRDHRLLDRGLVTFFPGPASYTGEDLVELSVHGSPLLVSMLMDALVWAGARRAEAGEFTRRAYLNGKLDLVRAEAVADLIDADSPAAHGVAVHQVEGGLSRRIGSLRARLVEVEALVMHHVDFPEEDEPPVSIAHVVAAARKVEADLDGLLASAPEGELLREGALVVLAGRPNAGKSSLYNALIGEDRAIVTEEAGTTRDALEARVSLGGYPFRMVDTAGLRGGAVGVERLGIEVAERYLDRADVILLCFAGHRGWGGEEEAFLKRWGGRVPVLAVRTQIDRSDARSGEKKSGPREMGVSVRSGAGLGELRERLGELVYAGLTASGVEAPVLTRRRQRLAVREARDRVGEFCTALDLGVPAEAAVLEVRDAEAALGELVGGVSTEDVLDEVFRQFCIGK